MSKIPVIAVFDVGKTNKKVFLFNEQYGIVLEHQYFLPETTDEDGDPCEDLAGVTDWLQRELTEVRALPGFDLRAINFSAYGASFVYLNDQGQPLTPLYNYLKPYPDTLLNEFYEKYGGADVFAATTASPRLGSLNSGMQLYRIKKERPVLFARIRHALHLPQFLAYLVSKQYHTDITSVGCHSNLWNFPQNDYHEWVEREGLTEKLAPLVPCTQADPVVTGDRPVAVGIGLHDSSAALIPYLKSFHEPFVLISTGTWCINLNPFNDQPLTAAELGADCLCYLSFQGKPVKASRFFAGHFHDAAVSRLNQYFGTEKDHFTTVRYDEMFCRQLRRSARPADASGGTAGFVFSRRDLSAFGSFEEAYTQLMIDLVDEEKTALDLVLAGSAVRRLFVDGGFGRNPLFMHLLAEAVPQTEVFAASVPQATALGAALAIHGSWNSKPMPGDIIDLRFYAVSATESPNGQQPYRYE